MFQKFLEKYWEEPHGDKRVELVFISRDLNEKEVRGILDDCLVSEKLMPDEYEGFYKDIDDPFKDRYMQEWRHVIRQFEESGVLLLKDDEWEEVDEDDEDEDDEEESEEEKEEPKKKEEKAQEEVKVEKEG